MMRATKLKEQTNAGDCSRRTGGNRCLRLLVRCHRHVEHYAPLGNGLLTSTSASQCVTLPPDRRARRIWQHVEQQLAVAAAGADPVDASVALRLALMPEAIPNGANGKETRLNKH